MPSMTIKTSRSETRQTIRHSMAAPISRFRCFLFENEKQLVKCVFFLNGTKSTRKNNVELQERYILVFQVATSTTKLRGCSYYQFVIATTLAILRYHYDHYDYHYDHYDHYYRYYYDYHPQQACTENLIHLLMWIWPCAETLIH